MSDYSAGLIARTPKHQCPLGCGVWVYATYSGRFDFATDARHVCPTPARSEAAGGEDALGDAVADALRITAEVARDGRLRLDRQRLAALLDLARQQLAAAREEGRYGISAADAGMLANLLENLLSGMPILSEPEVEFGSRMIGELRARDGIIAATPTQPQRGEVDEIC